jgi:NADP-dependent 3-hydroxy acid dehydrogenase YdfG
MFDLIGRTVLITGASSGFGEALARICAREGARLVLCARRENRLKLLAEDLWESHETPVHLLALDITDAKAVAEALAGLPEHFAKIDVLVNNAGLSLGLTPIQEGDPEDWERMLRTNVEGLLRVTRAIVPGMVERGRGDIVNVCSTAGHDVYPGGGVYCASKHAVDAITRGLRMDLVATPLRVHQISPGIAETEFSVVRFKGDKARADMVYEGMKPLTAQDVAESILWMITRPAHVQVGDLVLWPTAQASPTLVHRAYEPEPVSSTVWDISEH